MRKQKQKGVRKRSFYGPFGTALREKPSFIPQPVPEPPGVRPAPAITGDYGGKSPRPSGYEMIS
ncbi:MAG: hypothetical protein C6P37_12965 [Caldibacillus debilis]|uniref:Uncharacterized protein n=1 Tax=Caldibacillus debilis TaxID=301148 RepID=A0A3E0K1T0_9BACI|nr:hypothetical protein [Bacillaceae bacterium]OUM84865.1 MAG: hypothetical protein BAA03_04395 [Caldibacillus debilis]REJ14157.1 MAG: hypothetical protein C6W57_14625 [Caldibacillus debilis]REJ24890.1 MAG: hypothetical protein C6W56_14030 [Caldibacillus debilis]REJ26969.1 MAG: hypothetical protein C6P37_12965 [Caldibacillus debilis]